VDVVKFSQQGKDSLQPQLQLKDKKMKNVIFLIVLLFTISAFGTVSDGETVRQSFAPNGSTTTFTFTFACNSSDDVLVYAPLTSTGDPIAALVEDTDYTIAPTSSSYLNGGVVTISPALASTFTVKIVRRIKQSQETSSGAITATSIVAALDKLTRQIQDAEDRKDRSLHLPESDSVSFDMTIPNSIDRAGKVLNFDGSGNVGVTSGTDTFTVVNGVYDDIIAGDIITKGPIIDVRAFGASPTASAADNVTAFNAAFAAAVDGTTVYVPAGTYSIDDDLVTSGVINFNLVGAGQKKTIISQTNAAATTLNFGVHGRSTISDINFSGGLIGIQINNANVNQQIVVIRNCFFNNQVSKCIETGGPNGTGSGANSTFLQVSSCLFTLESGMTYAVYDNQTDITNIEDCWAQMGGSSAFYNGGGTMSLIDVHCFSSPGFDTEGIWVTNTATVNIRDCIFGTENGAGQTVLRNSATSSGTHVTITGCRIAPRDQYAFKFVKLPSYITIKNNFGYSSLGSERSLGIWIDSDAGSVNRLLRDRIVIENNENIPYRIGDDISGGTANDAIYSNALAMHNNDNKGDPSRGILLADHISSKLSTSVATSTETTMTKGTATYDFLGGPTVTEYVATGDNALFTLTDSSAMGGDTSNANNYTAVWDVVIEATVPIYCKILAEGNAGEFTLTDGPHVLCVPYREVDSQTAHTIDMRGFASGDKCRIGRIRIFQGNKLVDTPFTIYDDVSTSVPPPGPRLRYDLGDKTVFSDYAGIGSRESLVTTAGSNGAEVFGNPEAAITDTLVVTATQLKALAATPITIVAAPASGYVTEFISAVLVYDYLTTPFTLNGDNDIAIRYTNGAGAIVSDTIDTAGFIDQANDEIRLAMPIAGTLDLVPSAVLVIDNIGGSEWTAGLGDLTVKVTYRTHLTGL